MYLRGSKWSMTRRRTRFNWFRILVLTLLIAAGVYFNRFIAPTIQPIGVPTPTATRPPESFVSEAEDLFAQGKLLQSIEAYQRAIRARPDDPTIYVALARVQVFAGQYDDAQTSAENALLLNPNNSMAHAVRGWALDFKGEVLAAEAAVKRALELDPNNGLAHAYYAEILVDSYLSGVGTFDALNRAAEESRIALALAGGSIEAHRARGYVLEATANYEQAIAEYEQAIAINPNIADLHLAVGRNYRALGVYDRAIEEFTRANSLNPADWQPELFIARTYATIGEYAKAVQFAEQAIKDNPSNAMLHGTLGVLYYRNYQWPEAAVELEIAIRGGRTEAGVQIAPIPLTANNPRVAEFYYVYGLVLARLNRCSEALLIFQEILSRIPGDEVAVYNVKQGQQICAENLSRGGAQPLPTAPTP